LLPCENLEEQNRNPNYLAASITVFS